MTEILRPFRKFEGAPKALVYRVGDRIWRERSDARWAVWVYQPDGRWALCVTVMPRDLYIAERTTKTPLWEPLLGPRGTERWEIIGPVS